MKTSIRRILTPPLAASAMFLGCVPTDDAPIQDTAIDTSADTTLDIATPPDTATPDVATPDTATPDVPVTPDVGPDATPDVITDTTPDDTTPPEDTVVVETPDGKIWLNEVVAARLDDGDDWIELKNGASTLTIDLSGWTLEDSGAAPYVIEAGTNLAPGARLVFEQTTFGFGLGSADSVTLRDADGNEIDTISWEAGAAPAGWSYGRLPDGDGEKGNWQTVKTPTNAAQNATISNTVVINEAVASDIGGGDDWIELVNLTDAEVDLAGWIVGDDGGNTFTLEAGTNIGTGTTKWWVIEQTTFGFGLGKADGVWLIDPSGVVHDITTWIDGENAAGQSRSRIPDGTGAFVTSAQPTKGETNLP